MTATATKAKTTRSTKRTTASRKSATPQTKATPETAVAEEAEVKAPEPKCASPRKQVAKPQSKMLRKIASIGEHPGKALRIKRWDRYKVGMTLQQCKETEGLDHLDVLFYEEHGLMTLTDPTDKEVDAAVAAWTKAKESSTKAA